MGHYNISSQVPSRRCLAPLDHLWQSVGLDTAVQLLEFALPYMATQRKVLLAALSTQDRALTRKQAHQTLSAVRVYGSVELENLLKNAATLEDTTDTAVLYRLLDEEFAQTRTAIRYWLQARALR